MISSCIAALDALPPAAHALTGTGFLLAVYEATIVDETELHSFSDSPTVSSWAVTGLEEAVKAGIVSGVATYTLAPQADATRAQAAAMIYKLLSVLGE